MRGLCPLVLVVLLLPTTQCCLSSPPEGPEAFFLDAKVLITELCPSYPGEHVVLTAGPEGANLSGWSLDDGEGRLTICHLLLGPGEKIGISTNLTRFHLIFGSVRCLEVGSEGCERKGSFALADNGDGLRLVDDEGNEVDAVVYGQIADHLTGWSGPQAPKPGKGSSLIRSGGDTNTSGDWEVAPSGRSEWSPERFTVRAEPFSSPEEAKDRVLREISLASIHVAVEIYELFDAEVVAVLCRKALAGLRVEVLVEGQPVGGLDQRSLAALAALRSSGATVNVIASEQGYKRYDYLHCKLLVVDGRRSLIMSENWGAGLEVNRGWGVVCDGPDMAAYLLALFQEDLRGAIDIKDPPVAVPMALTDVDREFTTYPRFECQALPLVLPDFGRDLLADLIDRSQQRILAELLYIEEDWTKEESLLTALVAAASRGVQVRVLLDAGWNREENARVADHLNCLGKSGGWDLQAGLMSPYHSISVMHNKGLIIDDQAVVSSMNWGDSAVRENREVGVILESSEVSEFFAHLFWNDWAEDPCPPSLSLSWENITVFEGTPVLIDASGSTDNSGISRIGFDLGADGTVDHNGTSWLLNLPAGEHIVVVTAYDLFNNSATAACKVMVMARPPVPGTELWLVWLVAAPVVLVFAMVAWKRIMLRRHH